MSSKDKRFVKSYPSLQNSPIWPDDGLFKLYHYCLYKASWNTFIWHGYQINPGEFPMSLRQAEEELCWSRNKLLRRLTVLERLGYIRTKKTSEGTLVWVKRCPDTSDSNYSQKADHVGGGIEVAPQWFQKRTTGGSVIEPQRSEFGTESGSAMEPYLEEYKNNTHSTVASDPDGFSAVWCAYPEDRRTDRAEAVQQYRLAISLGATPEAILDALNAVKCSETWRQDGGRFIPGISKWLQKETWRDYVNPAEDEEEELWVSR